MTTDNIFIFSASGNKFFYFCYCSVKYSDSKAFAFHIKDKVFSHYGKSYNAYISFFRHFQFSCFILLLFFCGHNGLYGHYGRFFDFHSPIDGLEMKKISSPSGIMLYPSFSFSGLYFFIISLREA